MDCDGFIVTLALAAALPSLGNPEAVEVCGGSSAVARTGDRLRLLLQMFCASEMLPSCRRSAQALHCERPRGLGCCGRRCRSQQCKEQAYERGETRLNTAEGLWDTAI